MKNKTLKAIIALTALVIFTGAIIFLCGFTRTLPKGVTVNGTPVGGLSLTAAKQRLREGVIASLKQKRLDICADEQVFSYTYPEIYFTDGFEKTLLSVSKKGEYFSAVTYFLNGATDICKNICACVSYPAEEPRFTFNKSGVPFTYFKGENGAAADYMELLEKVNQSLNGGFAPVRICTRALPYTKTEEGLRARTKKLSSYTTYFDGSNEARLSNIRLAAQKLNGSILCAGQVFSFNETVGVRSAQNGFKPAKIIENGRFVQGVGGGVCQVSTTLYNAALLCGLEICEQHPHSLQISYVPPSRDAMVSGSSADLKFKNTRPVPVYIRAECTQSSVTCTVYGPPDGYEYSFRTEITRLIPCPEPVIIYGEEERVISEGRQGVASLGYLIKTKNGVSEEKLIRRDVYPAAAPVKQLKKEG